jgi:predicted Zn-dependent protease
MSNARSANNNPNANANARQSQQMNARRRPAATSRPDVRPSSPRVETIEPNHEEKSVVAQRVSKSIQSIKSAGLNSIPATPSRSMVRNDQRSLQQIRGYSRQDLYAIAEVGYHYLFSGGVDVARALFDGLVAIAPEEAYFALALGLTADHQGSPEEAERWYARASQLDPHDGRADVNRAELYLERGDFPNARTLLARGAKKARIRQDVALERKATALIAHIDRS